MIFLNMFLKNRSNASVSSVFLMSSIRSSSCVIAPRYSHRFSAVIPPVKSFMYLLYPRNNPKKISTAIDSTNPNATFSNSPNSLKNILVIKYPGMNNANGSPITICSIDNIGCIVSAGSGCFAACSSITTFNLPSLVIAGTYCFDGCTSATTFDFPSLTTTGFYCF